MDECHATLLALQMALAFFIIQAHLSPQSRTIALTIKRNNWPAAWLQMLRLYPVDVCARIRRAQKELAEGPVGRKGQPEQLVAPGQQKLGDALTGRKSRHASGARQKEVSQGSHSTRHA